MSKGFDVSSLEQQDTFTGQLLHPATGEEIGATITIYGQDSAICKSESHKMADKVADYSAKHRNKPIPNELYAKFDRQKVIACTKSIDGLTDGGKPFTDVAAIFDRFPCFLEQGVQMLLDRANFIKDSSAK